ncbi:MAG: FecR domain-containing protein [Phycisphaerales bacterium]|nr:FecR domain-containing protein [Phycisphaerales bacterium]
MNSSKQTVLVVLAYVGLAASLATGGQPGNGQPPQPAGNQPAGMNQVQPVVTETVAFVIAAEGRVTYAETPEAKPVRVTKGMRLKPGGVLQTGLKSAVQIQIGAAQLITIDRLGSVTLNQLLNVGGVETTRLTMERGRLQFDVTSTVIQNDVKVQTPDATLAVKGTQGGIEVTDGFPTRAFGAERNTGVFLVTYASGTTATVTSNQETDAANPDPAENNQQSAFVDTQNAAARESDEVSVVQRSSGSGTSMTISTGISSKSTSAAAIADVDPITGEPFEPDAPPIDPPPIDPPPIDPPPVDPPPTLNKYFGYDLAQNEIVLIGSGGDAVTVYEEAADQLSGFAGLGMRIGPNGERQLVLMETAIVNQGDLDIFQVRLKGFNLDNPESPGTELATFSAGQFALQGLAGLGTRLYAEGIDILNGSGGNDSIFELVPEAGNIVHRMTITGAEFEGGLAGAPDRGTLFVTSNFIDDAGIDHRSLLEVDPRNNLLVDAHDFAESDITDATLLEVPFSQEDIIQINGMAYVDGVVVYSATVLSGNESTFNVLVRYNPDAAGTASDPRVVRVDEADIGRFYVGLSGDEAIVPLLPDTLSDPTWRIETSNIDTRFAQMAFSDTALASGVVERLVSNHILQTSIDPQGCSDSGALFSLPGILSRHVHQEGGIGQSVAEFRDGLPDGHDCDDFGPE